MHSSRFQCHYTDSHENYTGALTNNQPEHTEGHLLGISIDNPHICKHAHTHTHSKNLTKALHMIQSAKVFENEGIRLFQKGWICKGNRFSVVHLYGDEYKGLELCREAAVTARLNLYVFFTSAMTMPMWSRRFSNVLQYLQHKKLPQRQMTIRRGLELAWHLLKKSTFLFL